MRYVILPQAVRRVGPPLLNDFIALQKDVALISILGVARGIPVAQIDRRHRRSTTRRWSRRRCSISASRSRWRGWSTGGRAEGRVTR